MLRRVEEQPADVDSYIQTPYGVAAVRVDEVPAADEDEGLFGSPRPTVPVSPFVNCPLPFAFREASPACPRSSAAAIHMHAVAQTIAGCAAGELSGWRQEAGAPVQHVGDVA